MKCNCVCYILHFSFFFVHRLLFELNRFHTHSLLVNLHAGARSTIQIMKSVGCNSIFHCSKILHPHNFLKRTPFSGMQHFLTDEVGLYGWNRDFSLQTRFFVFFDPIHQGALWKQQRAHGKLPTHCLLHFPWISLDYGKAGNILEPIQERCRKPAIPPTSILVDDVRIHVLKSNWKSFRLEEPPPPSSLPFSTFNP